MQHPELHEVLTRVHESLSQSIAEAELMEQSPLSQGTQKIIILTLYLKMEEALWITGELLYMAETGEKSPRQNPPWIDHLERYIRNQVERVRAG